MKPTIAFILLIFISVPVVAQNAREIQVDNQDRYLNFPVSGWSSDFDGEQQMMRIIHEGNVLDEFSISLANGDPDWWAFFPIEKHRGETLIIEVDNPAGKPGLDEVFADSTFPGEKEIYNERYRQQVHFSSRRGWNNDPNGLIWYNGEWHLFYQHNPYGWAWGNMHWGHAVSTDLVHWQELPDALYSPDHDHMAFSGGAVVDPENTFGFRRDGVDPLIATYTRTGSGEHLALSYDNGRTFEEYEGNPVVEHRGRDPKVFWYEPGGHWVMIVYDESHTRKLDSGDEVRLYQHSIYTSPNLTDWTYQSGVTDFFECPELFELPVHGENGTSKWVMYDADGKYVVGAFDGKKFSVEQGLRKFDYGGDFYASQTYSNVPEEDGRRIQIGWFRTETPYMPFNQSMTFPAELNLKKNADGYLLYPQPIDEIEKLHNRSFQLENETISDTTISSPIRGDQQHIIAEFDKGDATQFGINVNGYELTYDILRSKLNDTFYPIEENLKLELIVDRMGIEVFVNDGELYYVEEYNSVDTEQFVNIFARGRGNPTLLVKNFEVHELSSIWDGK
ncbi:glycoside hydrolase family 32 protein [Aliifodinibius sp. S!AR15-10]|uniref:glycoside hydrolase family 32 protein n=1 Tax=Aliifodinibius sp. S!AR15-10 TaxID=2950437 RepID=UPI00285838BE|nr:glycoside hydrolase family 32 protein [Aliifodinibius sp. S!AR15-10]MDR8393410.1 glycoside hydrolase family 32 protein [Aliifodinibius sp. S!AR15-10]